MWSVDWAFNRNPRSVSALRFDGRIATDDTCPLDNSPQPKRIPGEGILKCHLGIEPDSIVHNGGEDAIVLYVNAHLDLGRLRMFAYITQCLLNDAEEKDFRFGIEPPLVTFRPKDGLDACLHRKGLQIVFDRWDHVELTRDQRSQVEDDVASFLDTALELGFDLSEHIDTLCAVSSCNGLAQIQFIIQPGQGLDQAVMDVEIGRASCRERV